jgi:NitT/TauT family transport system substrate-binding protein
MDRQAFLLASAALAASSAPLIASAQTRPSVSIATIANDPLVGPFYAKEQGFFEKAGLNATVSAMNNGAAVTAAVASGAVDIGGSNLQSLVLAYKKGVPIQLIAPAGLFNKTSPVAAIIVLKNSPIATAKDLEGKVVCASPLKSLGEFAVDIWVDKNGGDSSKVKFVEIPFGEMEAALVQGRVAAASLTEPYFSEAKGTCRVLALPYSAIAPQFLTSAFFTSVAFAKAHPDVVEKFAAAMRTTAQWANKNQPQSGAILAAQTKLDPKVIATMSRVAYAETLSTALIQPTIDLSFNFKQIDANYPAAEMIFQPGK